MVEARRTLSAVVLNGSRGDVYNDRVINEKGEGDTRKAGFLRFIQTGKMATPVDCVAINTYKVMVRAITKKPF